MLLCMGSKRKPKRTEEPRTVDFRPIGVKLKGFFFNLERELEKRAKLAPTRGERQGFLFLRASALGLYNYFGTICWLGSDEDETGKRPKWAALAIPSITRTMLDCLFTTVYMLEDFGPRSDLYHRSSYREQAEELELHRNAYGSEPDYQRFINLQTKNLTASASAQGLSEREVLHPRHLQYWPTPTQLVRDKLAKPENRRFFKWLNNWSYRYVSQIAHHSAIGVARTAGFLLVDMFPNKKEQIEGETALQFRSLYVGIATTVLLCFGSELNAVFSLGYDLDLQHLWKLAKGIVPAEEAWEIRYGAFLGPKKL
jgi:hypothetical protein